VEGILLGQTEDDNMPVSVSTMETVAEKRWFPDYYTYYSFNWSVSLI
jgi:hypothetical protein